MLSDEFKQEVTAFETFITTFPFNEMRAEDYTKDSSHEELEEGQEPPQQMWGATKNCIEKFLAFFSSLSCLNKDLKANYYEEVDYEVVLRLANALLGFRDKVNSVELAYNSWSVMKEDSRWVMRFQFSMQQFMERHDLPLSNYSNPINFLRQLSERVYDILNNHYGAENVTRFELLSRNGVINKVDYPFSPSNSSVYNRPPKSANKSPAIVVSQSNSALGTLNAASSDLDSDVTAVVRACLFEMVSGVEGSSRLDSKMSSVANSFDFGKEMSVLEPYLPEVSLPLKTPFLRSDSTNTRKLPVNLDLSLGAMPSLSRSSSDEDTSSLISSSSYAAMPFLSPSLSFADTPLLSSSSSCAAISPLQSPSLFFVAKPARSQRLFNTATQLTRSLFDVEMVAKNSLRSVKRHIDGQGDATIAPIEELGAPIQEERPIQHQRGRRLFF